MRTFFLALSAILCLTMTVSAADNELRSIATTGEATIYVSPNQIIVTFGIETFNTELVAATGTNKQAAATFVNSIKDLGIEEKYIQTDTLEVTIQYDNHNDQHNIEGYYARRSYSIKLMDTKLFEKLIATGLKNGANQLTGVDYQTTELRKYRDQARQMAIKAAKEKAILLAKELDCSVGKPRTISEGDNNIYYFGSSNWGNQYAQNQNAMQSIPATPDTSDTLPLGQIAVQASVNVTFALGD